MLRVGVLISGRGSNLQALLETCAQPEFPAKIVMVLSNKPDVAGLQRAKAAGVPAAVCDHRDHPDRETFERALDAHLRTSGVECVCLAGFMRVLTPWFVRQWHDRILNIHPSLLPAFPGMETHARALAAGVRFSGCTVHVVRPDVDAGPIIVQAAVPVWPDDTPDILAARVLAAEHRAYPLALRLVAEGKVDIIGDRAVIQAAAKPSDFLLLNPAENAAMPPQ